jgi:trimethylamine:corrinoid methyltransferase-like protein
MFAKVGATSDFLKLPETRKLFRSEQHLPSKVIDRGSLNSWEQSGKKDAFARSRERVQELLSSYKRPELAASVEQDLRMIVEQQAKKGGMDHLPGI